VAPPPVAAHPAAERKEDGTAIAVAASPRAIVMPSGHAYLVLSVGPAQRDGAIAFDILYLAGADSAELARPDAQERLAAVAREFVAALAPVVDAAPVEHLSVSAMFGKPGQGGAVERRWFARDGAGWRENPRATERGVAQVPPVDPTFTRDRDEEAGAREAAAEFISDAARGDYDAAWARTSAIVKAVMSRADFERTLAQLTRSGRGGEADVYVSFPVPMERFLPGSMMEAWMAREAADGPVVETLALRLDDDMQWRVANVVQLVRTPPPPTTVGQAKAPALETRAP
jgi:hypothetical protein